MRKTSLDMVYELAKKDERIFFIGSDLGFGTLKEFQAEMPKRFFMEGVSEANVVGMAAGLALEGGIVYVNTIATFLTRRCFEQNVLDLGLHKTRVRLIANGGGLVYAPLGPTHLAIDDIAIMRTIPNMTVVAVCDADEMRRLMPQTVDVPGPIYIRLAKGHDPIVSDPQKPFKLGSAIPVREGQDALIVTTGITLRTALAAAEELEKKGFSPAILHCHTLKPLDQAAILARARRVPVVVTVEEHTLMGGLGSAVAEILAENEFRRQPRLKRIGIPDVFPSEYGSQDSQMETFGITPETIIEAVVGARGREAVKV